MNLCLVSSIYYHEIRPLLILTASKVTSRCALALGGSIIGMLACFCYAVTVVDIRHNLPITKAQVGWHLD